MTEDCLAAPSKYKADDNVGVPEGRTRRELVSHDGDVVNVACRSEQNEKKKQSAERSQTAIEKPHRIADGPLRYCCLE
jgi:hypothetical protein